MRPISVIFCTVFVAWNAASQETHPATDREQPAHNEAGPIYRVTVISRSTKAINYGHVTEPTKVGMKGTVLLPEAEGQARVRSSQGSVDIELKVSHLEPPTRFGPEYLTYVLWAITPEGRPVNLGELVPDPDNKVKLKVSVDLQAFALIISAEPYFAVLQPSDVVVMENVVAPGTIGKVEEVDAKYELLPRKQFTYDATTAPATPQGPKVSMDQYEALLALYQAQNAIQIAKAAGADRYAGDTLEKARRLYQEALTLQAQKAGTKQIVANAREAAQTAEDARLITAKRQPVEPASRP